MQPPLSTTSARDVLIAALKTRRKAKGITITALAATLGTSRRQLQRLEAGTHDPALWLLMKYGLAMHMRLEWTSNQTPIIQRPAQSAQL